MLIQVSKNQGIILPAVLFVCRVCCRSMRYYYVLLSRLMLHAPFGAVMWHSLGDETFSAWKVLTLRSVDHFQEVGHGFWREKYCFGASQTYFHMCHLGLPGYRGGRHLWKGYSQSFPNRIRIIWIHKKSSTGRMEKKRIFFCLIKTSIQSSVFFPQAEVLEAKRKKAENHSFLLLTVHLCTLHCLL